VESKDLVSNIILTNTNTYLNYTSENSSSIFKPKKIIRTEVGSKTIWDIDYSEKQNLNRTEKFSFEKIKNSIDYILNDSTINSNLSAKLLNSLKNIEKISFSETTDGFSCRFILNAPDPDFLTALSQIPVLNQENAKDLGAEISKGTNLPIYGKFLISEAVPDSHYLLTKNPSYGLGSDTATIDKVSIKKFPDSESRMRAIRSGSIAIIVAPTINEVRDAETDPTLEIIDSPISKKQLK
jgi:ABC-type transport system substrate-binding protein